MPSLSQWLMAQPAAFSDLKCWQPTSDWLKITACLRCAPHLLEMSGETAAACEAYRAAARRASNLPQQRYLNARAERLIRS
jgi:hypothetical protein